ncbi:MAG: alginate export family protein [Akkermansiaceae bacterium]|nr:alginate export family protein [Akkermansiaceae bacterium]
MKKLLLLTLSPSLALAAPPSPDIATVGASEYWIKPTLDIRARYEFGDVDGSDPSHAFTLRERIGLQTQDWNGFSAFVEGEFTQAAIDDYNGGAPGVTPAVGGNTAIADPETNEFNQGYVQYKGFDSTFRLGRQRIIYDSAAFIGNVGWRQNEQTYDAFSISNTSIDGLTLQYAYVNQVNRIFGSDATGNFDYDGMDTHLLNAAYTGIEGFTVGGYIYLIDFDQINAADCDTYGTYVKTNQLGLDLYAELALQTNGGAAGNDDSSYAHVTATKAFGTQSVTLGMEHLSAGFRTPLATLHAFNGFSDVLLLGRFNGLGSGAVGLTDMYVSHTMPIFFGMKWINTLHAFGDNEISTGRGWEYDSVLVKKFDENFTGIAKLAHFETESNLPTTTRFSMELNYKF